MDEVKAPLVINKLQSKAIFDKMIEKDMVGNTELYLIQKDDISEVVSVNYDTNNKKFYYTNTEGNNTDIVSTNVLKQQLNLNEVATNGSYDSLSNRPRINDVILSGDKTTADLKLNYNELENLPTIPQLTSTYSATDETKAMTGKGVASAIGNYVTKATSVTGSGAIIGGGTLTDNVTLTHRLAPTGLNTQALTIAVDEYGHVQAGAPISASEVGAQPITYNVIQTCVNIEASNYGTIVILGTQDESVSFASVPPIGQKLRIYYANITDNNITVTVDPANFTSSTYFFFNGKVLTSAENYVVAKNTNLCMDIALFAYNDGTRDVVLTFADVLDK